MERQANRPAETAVKAKGGRRTPISDEASRAQSRDFARLREVVIAAPDIRTELVDRVRRELAAGLYKVDVGRIADELLREA